MISDPFTLIIDTREQKPVLWDKEGDPWFKDMFVKNGTLKTGDYSIEGMDKPDCEYSICIERKSLPDLFGSTGRGRGRLKKEFERMAGYDYAAIVLEADLNTIFRDPPPITAMKAKAVYRTLIAFSLRYGVHVWPCPNRHFAEKHIYLTLQRFWQDRRPGGALWAKK